MTYDVEPSAINSSKKSSTVRSEVKVQHINPNETEVKFFKSKTIDQMAKEMKDEVFSNRFLDRAYKRAMKYIANYEKDNGKKITFESDYHKEKFIRMFYSGSNGKLSKIPKVWTVALKEKGYTGIADIFTYAESKGLIQSFSKGATQGKIVLKENLQITIAKAFLKAGRIDQVQYDKAVSFVK